MATIKLDNLFLAGIPCSAEIDVYKAERQTHTDPGYPAGWELIQVLDRKGYIALWLEAKLSDPFIELAFNTSIDDALVGYDQDCESDRGDHLYELEKDRRLGF